MPSGCRRFSACKTWLEQSGTISPESMHEAFNIGTQTDFWSQYWTQQDPGRPDSETRQSSQKAQRQQSSQKQSLLTSMDAAAAHRLLSFEIL